MTDDAFRVEEKARVATVWLDRPDEGNRLLTHEVRALGRAIREAGSRPSVAVVLVRAEGDSFCLGRQPDPDGKAPTTALGIRSGVTEPILDLYDDVRATEVPVIAVVQGEAKGFGCAFVGQCDLAIAADTATFSMPEMDKHLPPTLAMSAVLGKIPPKRLLHLVYTRSQIDAAEALSIGLLSQVVALSEIDAAVAQTVSCFTDRSRPALCAVKEYMGLAPHLDSAAAARLAANILSTVLSSPKEV